MVRLRPDDRAGQRGSSPAGTAPVAAYLRIEPGPDGGPATARYVVRPEFRSRGISTLLVEMLGQDPAAGITRDVAPLRIWARGDHPAAQRMARRFAHLGVRPAAASGSCSHPCGPRARPAPLGRRAAPPPRPPAGAAEQAAATALLGSEQVPRQPEVLVDGPGVAGAVWYDPHADEHTEYGTAGRIIAVRAAGAASPQIQARLLAAAMAGLHFRGLRVAAITVDADDPVLARTCRLLGFQHDRTDIEYIVTGQASAEVSR